MISWPDSFWIFSKTANRVWGVYEEKRMFTLQLENKQTKNREKMMDRYFPIYVKETSWT